MRLVYRNRSVRSDVSEPRRHRRHLLSKCVVATVVLAATFIPVQAVLAPSANAANLSPAYCLSNYLFCIYEQVNYRWHTQTWGSNPQTGVCYTFNSLLYNKSSSAVNFLRYRTRANIFDSPNCSGYRITWVNHKDQLPYMGGADKGSSVMFVRY